MKRSVCWSTSARIDGALNVVAAAAASPDTTFRRLTRFISLTLTRVPAPQTSALQCCMAMAAPSPGAQMSQQDTSGALSSSRQKDFKKRKEPLQHCDAPTQHRPRRCTPLATAIARDGGSACHGRYRDRHVQQTWQNAQASFDRRHELHRRCRREIPGVAGQGPTTRVGNLFPGLLTDIPAAIV